MLQKHQVQTGRQYPQEHSTVCIKLCQNEVRNIVGVRETVNTSMERWSTPMKRSQPRGHQKQTN